MKIIFSNTNLFFTPQLQNLVQFFFLKSKTYYSLLLLILQFHGVYSVSCLLFRTSHLKSQQQPQQPPPPTQNASSIPIKDHFKPTLTHNQIVRNPKTKAQINSLIATTTTARSFACNCKYLIILDSYPFLVFQVCNQPHCVFIFSFTFFFFCLVAEKMKENYPYFTFWYR